MSKVLECEFPDNGELVTTLRFLAYQADQLRTNELLGLTIENGLAMFHGTTVKDVRVIAAQDDALRVRTPHLFAGAVRTIADLLEDEGGRGVRLRARSIHGDGEGEIAFSLVT